MRSLPTPIRRTAPTLALAVALVGPALAAAGPASATPAVGVPASASTLDDEVAAPVAPASVLPVVKPKVFTFESGKTSGWKGVGPSHVTVSPAAARTGLLGLQVTSVTGEDTGATWTRLPSSFPGSGPWYRLQVPVRLAAGPTPGQPTGLVWLRLDGISDIWTAPTAVGPDSWTVLDAWFQPASDTGEVTITLEQPPAVPGGPVVGPLGTLYVDDITLTRAAALPPEA